MSALTAYALGVVALHDKFLASHAPSRFGAVARARNRIVYSYRSCRRPGGSKRGVPDQLKKKNLGRRGKRCRCGRFGAARRVRREWPAAVPAARASRRRLVSRSGRACRHVNNRPTRPARARAARCPPDGAVPGRPCLALRRVAPRARDVRGRCSRALVQDRRERERLYHLLHSPYCGLW